MPLPLLAGEQGIPVGPSWIETAAVEPVEESRTGRVDAVDLQQLKQDFIDKRFGMFLCYNIMSYGARWGQANYPIDSFNPQKLDCEQWAQAAVSAGMTFGLLTTKHHEGFCLWDSKYTDYDVASTPYKKDIVRQFVDAFRRHGLAIGLYYSIWDSSHGVDKGEIDDQKMAFIKGQITELLTQYGKIDYFVIDGWFWRMGHHEVPFEEIRVLIRELQPHCLITDHTHLQAPYHLDIPYFEGPFGAFPVEGNIMASALGHCSVKGNGWFWGPETPQGLKEDDGVEVIIDKLKTCESRYCNFMLNCMPNRDGLLDPLFINLLAEIGKKWRPDMARPLLPTQGPQIVESLPIRSVSATSGEADYLIDATKIPGGNFYDWQSAPTMPQSIIIDLGQVQKNIDILLVVHKHQSKPRPEHALADGNIISCNVYASRDRASWHKVASKKWSAPAAYRAIGFEKCDARYLKLEILKAHGQSAVVTELEVGRSGG